MRCLLVPSFISFWISGLGCQTFSKLLCKAIQNSVVSLSLKEQTRRLSYPIETCKVCLIDKSFVETPLICSIVFERLIFLVGCLKQD